MVKEVFDRNVENKYLTTTFDEEITATGGGQLYILNATTQGVAGTQRIGNRLKWATVRFRYQLVPGITVDIPYYRIRFMLLWSRAPLNSALMPTPNAPINPLQQNFKILYDRSHILLPQDTDAGDTRELIWQTKHTIFRKINGNSTYISGAGSVNPNAGFLSLWVTTDVGPAPTEGARFTATFITSFQDA